MPASTKLQETYGDDLQVIFVESQRATPAQAEGFTLARRWLGGRSMWSSEQPFETGATSLPYFVLLGNDGRVLLKGNPLSQPKEIERQISEQIKNRKCAPPETPRYVKPAWSELNTGRIAKAFECLREVARESPDDSEVQDAVRQADKEFRGRIDREVARVKWLIDHALYDEAGSRLDTLLKSTRGETGIHQRLTELSMQLESPQLQRERQAARALARMLPEFFESGGNARTALELARFAEEYKGTQAALRADYLLKLPRS